MLKVYTGVFAGVAPKTLQGVCKTWAEVNIMLLMTLREK